jgi:phenylalanyl-tRNA synthetase beta chain
MLEYGQPLHAFDYHKLRGKQIIVRRARDAETVATLDGVERTFGPDVLVIADEEGAVAVAGIMGGLNAAVTDKTSTILLESANFNQAIIRLGCSYLNLQSEASIRFDKGLNPDLPLLPLKRATQLLLQLAGGKAAKGIIDVYPGKSEPKSILLPTEQVKRLSGLEVDLDKMLQILTSLGFKCQKTDSKTQILVSVPYWRSDIQCSADLAEEVVRVIGYDKVPITRLSGPLPAKESKVFATRQQNNLKQKVRSILVGCGFQEILTYSLTSLERLQNLSPKLELKVAPLKVVNPMTREQEYLRTTLQAGLLATLAHNQKITEAGIRLFEIGKIFLARGRELPEEKEILCAGLSGSRCELSWHGNKELLDFFDAKGVAENLLSQLGLEATFENSDDESLFPGRSADIIVGDDKVGIVGDLHPKVARAFELSGTVCLIEMDMEKLYDKAAKLKEYYPVHRFPSVTRDIALVIDEGVNYQRVERVIQSFPLVTEVILFDLYTGEQIPKGKKSFALRIVYQSPIHTLTDEEVNQTQQQMLDRLHQELGANLRD